MCPQKRMKITLIQRRYARRSVRVIADVGRRDYQAQGISRKQKRNLMRKLILQMQCSLDGFVSGPNGELDWIFPDLDAEYAAWGVERLWRAGAHLMGGVTFRDMAAQWPSSTEPYAAPMNQALRRLPD